MSDEYIDQVINEVFNKPPSPIENKSEPQPEANLESTQEAEAEAQPIENDETEVVEEDAQTNDESDDESDDQSDEREQSEDKREKFSKKAENALSRKKKQLANLRDKYAALEARARELEQLQAQNAPQNQGAPREEDFENYGDYLKAVAVHEFKQAQEVEQKKALEAQFHEQQQQQVMAKAQYVADKAKDAMKSIPDFKALYAENVDTIESLPKVVEEAFLDLDEPALAFYALAKENDGAGLEKLTDPNLSYKDVLKTLINAQLRGQDLAKRKPIPKAAAPIESLKGTGNYTKPLHHQSAEELMKWINS